MRTVLYVGDVDLTQEIAKMILDEHGEYVLSIYRTESEDLELLKKLVIENEIICYTSSVKSVLNEFDITQKVLIEI